MSDPQPPAPSSYYATTRLPETDLPPPPAAPERRSRLWLYVAIGVVLVLAIGAGVAFTVGRTLFQAQRSIPKLLGDDTQLYLAFTPNLSAIPGVQRLQAAYPQLFLDKDTTTIDKQLDELLGVNFKDDVQPWIGAEMAIAVNGIKTIAPQGGALGASPEEMLADQAKVSIILASRDNDKAQAFLDKQRASRGGKGQQFSQSEHNGVAIYEQQNADHSPLAAFALTQGYVIFASDAATINSIIDRASDAKATLDGSPRFKGVLDNLPKSAIGYLYVDGASASGVFDSAVQESLSGMPAGQQQKLKDQLNNLKALQGMGISLSADAEGMQFDSAANFDTSKLDATMKAQLEDARTPADAARLKNISDKATALFTFRIPSTFKNQILDAIKAQENGEEQLKEFESQVGLDLEKDLLDWLVGDVSLVVLPGEKLGDVTIPATGYFALKPQDKSAAEKGMEKIGVVLKQFGQAQGIEFEEEKVGDVSWQVVKEPQNQQVLGGYGFAKDELVIAFGMNALEAAGGAPASIADEASFKLVNSKLANPNSGVLYVNVTNAVELADKLGVGAEDTPEEQEFRKNVKPIKAVGFAAEPGIDQNGTARARLFIYINDK
jgi:hypothetical protein